MTALDDFLAAHDRIATGIEDAQAAYAKLTVDANEIIRNRPSTAEEIDYWSRLILDEIPEQQFDAKPDDPEESRWFRLALYTNAIRGIDTARGALIASGRHPGGRDVPAERKALDEAVLRRILDLVTAAVDEEDDPELNARLSSGQCIALIPLLRAVLQDEPAT